MLAILPPAKRKLLESLLSPWFCTTSSGRGWGEREPTGRRCRSAQMGQRPKKIVGAHSSFWSRHSPAQRHGSSSLGTSYPVISFLWLHAKVLCGKLSFQKVVVSHSAMGRSAVPARNWPAGSGRRTGLPGRRRTLGPGWSRHLAALAAPGSRPGSARRVPSHQLNYSISQPLNFNKYTICSPSVWEFNHLLGSRIILQQLPMSLSALMELQPHLCKSDKF